MRPIVGAQLEKNAGEVVLNRRFSNAELVRDLLVGIACARVWSHFMMRQQNDMK